MKTKSILLSLIACTSAICAMAQENDDMYFSASDRAKINLRSREEVVLASAKSSGTAQTINPSDSYSARNENPDYVAGSKVGSNTSTSPYFNPSYQPTVNQSLYANNCNCGYNNNYAYNNPYYGYGRYGFGSPYSSFYPYGYGGYGMNSFGMGYGMGYYGMGYGMGMMGMGMGYGMYGSPYFGYGYSPFGYGGYGYSPFGYGYGYGGYYGYGSPMIVTSGASGSADYAGPVYGRHPSRSTASNTSYYTNSGRMGRSSSGGSTAYYNGGSRSMSGARTMSSSPSSAYYNNAWRQSAANNRGNTWNTSGAGNRSSFWNNTNTNSTWSNPGGTTRQSWSSPGSNWGNSGGGMRTSGFSGGGGGFSGGGGHAGGGGGGHGRR